MRARAASWACWALTVPGNWTGQRLVQHLHKAAVWEAANTTGPRDTPGHCCCVWGLRTVIGIQVLTDVTANDLALKPWSGPSMRLLAAACCPSSPELHSCLQTPAHTPTDTKPQVLVTQPDGDFPAACILDSVGNPVCPSYQATWPSASLKLAQQCPLSAADTFQAPQWTPEIFR